MEAEAGSQVLAKLGSDLDGRFKTVRNEEANLGNLLADVAMAALQVSHPMIVFSYICQFSTLWLCVVSLAFSTETLEFTRNNQPSAVLRAAAKSGNYGLQARHLNILLFLLVAIADHHQLDVSHK